VVLNANDEMLDLAARLGFTRGPSRYGEVAVVRPLRPTTGR